MLAKKQQTELEIIEAAEALSEKVIDRHVRALKASHPSLPEVALRKDIMMHTNNVWAIAKHLLQKEVQ